MKNLLVCLCLVLCLVVTSCGLDEKSYPEELFEKVKLNGNKIPDGFKKYFTEIRGHL